LDRVGGNFAAKPILVAGDRLARLVLVGTGGLVGRVRPAPGALLALIRHSARPSERTTLRLLRQMTVDPARVRRQLGERGAACIADRARQRLRRQR